MNVIEFLRSRGILAAPGELVFSQALIGIMDDFANHRVEEYKRLSTKPPREKTVSPSMLNEFGMAINVGGAPMDVVCHNQVQLELVDALAGFLKHKGDASFLVNHLNKIRT